MNFEKNCCQVCRVIFLYNLWKNYKTDGIPISYRRMQNSELDHEKFREESGKGELVWASSFNFKKSSKTSKIIYIR